MISFMSNHSNCAHIQVDCYQRLTAFSLLNIFFPTTGIQLARDIVSPLLTSYSGQWSKLQTNYPILFTITLPKHVSSPRVSDWLTQEWHHQHHCHNCSILSHSNWTQYWGDGCFHACSPGCSQRSTDPTMTSSAPQLRWMPPTPTTLPPTADLS